MPTLLYHHGKVADAGEPQELIRLLLVLAQQLPLW